MKKDIVYTVLMVIGIISAIAGLITASYKETEYLLGMEWDVSYPYLYLGIVIFIIGTIIAISSYLLKRKSTQ